MVAGRALEGDLRAVFGGLILLNFAVDETIAEVLMTHKCRKAGAVCWMGSSPLISRREPWKCSSARGTSAGF